MKSKHSIKTFLICLLSVAAAMLLLLFPDTCTDGAYRGIVTCLEVLVPSLFPFMVLTLFLTESGLIFRIFKLPAAALSRLSGVPARCCTLFFLGMIGGYPCAAKNIALLCRRGEIDPKTAARMLCFCTNAGPAFIISAVGSKMFLSAQIGAVLFISSLLASFTALLFSHSKLKNTPEVLTPSKKQPLSVSLLSAVKGGCSATVLVCAFVILFSVLIAAVPSGGKALPGRQLLFAILEVTCGCGVLAGDLTLGSILAASAAIGWGGICVMFQISAICGEAGISVRPYVFSRFLQAALQPFYTFLMLLMIPIQTQETFLSTAGRVSSVFPAAPLPALLLLLCCLTFPLCLENQKKF